MRNPGSFRQFLIFVFFLLLISTTANSQPEMVYVEGGSFMMGRDDANDKIKGAEFSNELPRHEIKLNSFYIGKYEITVKEYKEFAEAKKKAMPAPPDSAWFAEHPDTKMFYPLSKNQWWGWKDNFPMQNITWFEAVEYCNWLSEKQGLQKVYTINKNEVSWDLAANGYRLPTEAEWEYAARGGKLSKGYRFSGSNNIDEVAWYDGTTKFKGPAPIGTKKANELGIFDMSGNVWEWCNDYFTSNYYSHSAKENPPGPGPNTYRTLRGGSWHYRDEYARIADRDGPNAAFTNFNYGFRIAKNK